MIHGITAGHPPPINTTDTSQISPSETPMTQAQHAAETAKHFGNVETLLTSYNVRGIKNFHVPGELQRAAAALALAKRVAICTGFNVAEGMPETDGPPGAAILANALQGMGKTVTIVTDSVNKPLVQAALKVLNPNFSDYCRFSVFDEKDGHAAVAKAKHILSEYKIDTVVAGELTGRAGDGIRRNMRGVNINPFNAAVDELLNQANKQDGVTTIGIGDGGNEAGMGGLSGVPLAQNGEAMQAAIGANHQVTAWNSNFGFEALARTAGKLTGKSDAALDRMLPAFDQHLDIITAVLNAAPKAGDGVTRGGIDKLNQEEKDGAGRPVWTGVDGFPTAVHAGMTAMLKNIASQIPRQLPADGMIAAQAPGTAEPFVIGAFDSSNGGLIAAGNLARFLAARSNHEARFVVLTDHGNAPYGVKTTPELNIVVGDGMKTAAACGVDVIAMACNTACTGFENENNEAGLSLDKFKNDHGIQILDLIAITAKAIAEHGGAKPAVLSTDATAKDDMYQNRIEAAAAAAGKDKPDVQRIGCGDWATLINELAHEDPDRAVEVDAAVAREVQRIPKDATSVYLCCTHYPAFKEKIEAKLKQYDLGHIKVIDPMEYQAEAIIKLLDALPTDADYQKKSTSREHADRTGRTSDADSKFFVVTTANRRSEVKRSIETLIGKNDGDEVVVARGMSKRARRTGPDDLHASNAALAPWTLSGRHRVDSDDSDSESEEKSAVA